MSHKRSRLTEYKIGTILMTNEYKETLVIDGSSLMQLETIHALALGMLQDNHQN